MTVIVIQHTLDEVVLAKSISIAKKVQEDFSDDIAGQINTLTRALCMLAHYYGVEEDDLLYNVSSTLLQIDAAIIRE